jgi:hypothetical protein
MGAFIGKPAGRVKSVRRNLTQRKGLWQFCHIETADGLRLTLADECPLGDQT